MSQYENAKVEQSRNLFHEVNDKTERLTENDPRKKVFKERAQKLYESMDVTGLQALSDELRQIQGSLEK